MKDHFEQDRDTLGYWFQLDEEMKIGVIAETLLKNKFITFFDIDKYCKRDQERVDKLAIRYVHRLEKQMFWGTDRLYPNRRV
jgi:hypothetical protein